MGSSASTPVEYSPVIETQSGPVRGKVFTFDEKKYDAFLGIPYAQPPVGELRFKKPEPAIPWKETRDCISFGPRSPQKDDFISRQMNIVGIDEAGCLTVNVVAPRNKSEEWPEGYPVMVWIHGGGFTLHSSSNYGDSTAARNLCSKDVIFVSLNYRLGVLGFFATGDDTCKGNLGLWDQTLALKWVNKNIHHFGGNSKNITIFGQSAGGASVDLLSLSPHSRDLFQRAIPMAGTAECTFAIRSNQDQTSISKNFARHIGWQGNDDDINGMMDFLAAQPSSILFADMSPNKGFSFKEAGSIPFVPNFDGDFFPRPLSQLRKEMPKKDILTGTTEAEGLTLSFMAKIPFSLKGMRGTMSHMLKESEFGSDYEKIHEQAIDFYTKDIDVKDKKQVIEKHSQLIGDLIICNGAIQYAKNMSKLGHNVYFYNFEHYNPDGFGLFRWILPFRAASHCTELRYVLGKGIFSKFQPNDDDLKILKIMTTFFTNFAKYGNPNGKEGDGVWEKHSSEDPFRHLNIQLPEPKMVNDYQGRRFEFWESILQKNQAWSKIY